MILLLSNIPRAWAPELGIYLQRRHGPGSRMLISFITGAVVGVQVQTTFRGTGADWHAWSPVFSLGS